jgi:hypothetical protein
MANLSDFVEDPEAPEVRAKQQLSDWASRHGARVFWEPDEPAGRFGYETFDADSASRPDLLFLSQHSPTGFAAEVKVGDDSGGVHDGVMQTVRYWVQAQNGDLTFTVDGEVVDVTAFITATANSPDGHLFYRYGERESPRERHISERIEWFDPPFFWIPDWEFSSTETSVRLMQRAAKMLDRIGTVETLNETPGLGALLSQRLDGNQPVPRAPQDDPPHQLSADDCPMSLYFTFGGSSVERHNWGWV